MCSETGKFSPSDYLLALRRVKVFNQDNIRRKVVEAAFPQEETRSWAGEVVREKYLELLASMGYVLEHHRQRTGISDSKHYISTFKKPEIIKDLSSQDIVDEIAPMEAYLKSLLKEIGFGHVFRRIVITDNLQTAVKKFWDERRIADDPKWVHLLLPSKIKTPIGVDRGGIVVFDESSGPTLFINVNKPAHITLDANRILQMRVVHEIYHFLLHHMLFDGGASKSLAILEFAGEDIGHYALTLIEESFAHMETARLFPKDYFRLIPPKLKLTDLDCGQMRWWSKKMVYWALTYSFSIAFPWICTASRFGITEIADRLYTAFPDVFVELGTSLLPPLHECYDQAALVPQCLVEIAQILEQRKFLPYIHAWWSYGEFWTLYKDELFDILETHTQAISELPLHQEGPS